MGVVVTELALRFNADLGSEGWTKAVAGTVPLDELTALAGLLAIDTG